MISQEGPNFECVDETGDCGPCQPGFTGLQCDQCETDFERVEFPSGGPEFPDGQLINCKKCSESCHF